MSSIEDKIDVKLIIIIIVFNSVIIHSSFQPENGGSGWGDDLDWNIDGH